MTHFKRARALKGLLGLAITAFMPLTAYANFPSPKLDFEEFQWALAESVASDSDLAAYYGALGLRSIFADRPAHLDALATIPHAARGHGLPEMRYVVEPVVQDPNLTEAERLAQTEAARVRVLANWARDVSSGLLDPSSVDSGIKRSPRRPELVSVLSGYLAATDPAAYLAAMGPTDPRYTQMREMLEKNLALVAPAGTPEVPKGLYRLEMRAPEIATLRMRLGAIGIAAESADPELFDASLEAAVKQFQDRAGLATDGIAGPSTIARLNGGAGPESRALMMSLERMRWLSGHDLSARHVWVNLPSFIGEIRENNRQVFATRVVIGKTDADRRTPEFSDEMEWVVPNPRWNVPNSITTKEYLPKLQADRNAVSHLDVVDNKGRIVLRENIDFSKYSTSNFPYRLRQKPSDDNALGLVKFLFPNRWNIYLHDTPSKSLFGENVRAYSHGCVRVGRPFELAYELLAPQTSDPRGLFHRMLDTGEEKWIKLDPFVPVHLVYFTTLPDDSGVLRRYSDIYGRDAQLWAALKKAGL